MATRRMRFRVRTEDWEPVAQYRPVRSQPPRVLRLAGAVALAVVAFVGAALPAWRAHSGAAASAATETHNATAPAQHAGAHDTPAPAAPLQVPHRVTPVPAPPGPIPQAQYREIHANVR